MKPSIVILTGAGISAESGIQTFRGDDGLWEGHRIEDVATPEGFERDRALVQRFYNERRRKLLSGVEPNSGHVALAKLEKEYPGEVTLVTQNIDNLHERGGSQEVLHMHGELCKARCLSCGGRQAVSDDIDENSSCDSCGLMGNLRPDVVWFGEMPYFMTRIESALLSAGIFLSIGTSSQVYPAAGFVEIAKHAGADTVEVNLAETSGSDCFARKLRGKAGTILPSFVDELLA